MGNYLSSHFLQFNFLNNLVASHGGLLVEQILSSGRIVRGANNALKGSNHGMKLKRDATR